MPLISIILPVYNAEKYLEESITSIINQTYKNLEIICLDDGSTDNSKEIIKHFAKNDKRIKIIENTHNLGLIKTLNKAIELANGEYIARMDADDISLPNRTEKQYKFLINYKLDICDCQIKYINENNKVIKRSNFIPKTKYGIIFYSFFKTPLLHPTVLTKKEIFKNNLYNYSKETIHCEDYELWTRLIQKNIKIGKLSEQLYIQIINNESVSNKYEDIQKSNFILLSKKYVESYFNIDVSHEVWRYSINRFNKNDEEVKLKEGINLINDIKSLFFRSCNIVKNSLESKEIEHIVNQQILDIYIQYLKKQNKIKALKHLLFTKYLWIEPLFLLENFNFSYVWHYGIYIAEYE